MRPGRTSVKPTPSHPRSHRTRPAIPPASPAAVRVAGAGGADCDVPGEEAEGLGRRGGRLAGGKQKPLNGDGRLEAAADDDIQLRGGIALAEHNLARSITFANGEGRQRFQSSGRRGT